LKREIIITSDGSTTIHLADWNENYHSKHGAIQEANHVFIKMGLSLFFEQKECAVLEIGFGTGLNVLLTLLNSEKNNLKVNYETIEGHPVEFSEIQNINFPEQLKIDRSLFNHLHQAEWEVSHQITKNFSLKKRKLFFDQIINNNQFDLIYFDAFGPRVQPELWTASIFNLMFNALKSKGILVTYSANSNARRAMQAVGFLVEKLPGPPGKREMLRATKP
jgi:tRNA U34 5-methylaminomethyl-2-thiouridine-forming methyltransferase MnmC